MSQSLTKPSVHVDKAIVVMVQLAVFEQSPELHACHDESVVGTSALFMSETTVERVDSMQTCHVTQHHRRYLHVEYIHTFLHKRFCLLSCAAFFNLLFVWTNVGYKDRLEILSLESLQLRRIHQDLIYSYKIIFGLIDIQGGPKKLRQIFLAITLVNMDRF